MVRKAAARLVPLPVEREVPCGAGPAAQAVLLRMDGETLHGRVPGGSGHHRTDGGWPRPCAVGTPPAVRWRSGKRLKFDFIH